MAKRSKPERQRVNCGTGAKYGIPAIIEDPEFVEKFKQHYKSKITSEYMQGAFDKIIELIINDGKQLTNFPRESVTRWTYEIFLIILTNFSDKERKLNKD